MKGNRLLLFVWSAVAVLLLLASGLSTLTLETGRPFAWAWLLLEAGERLQANILGLVILALLLYIIVILFFIPAHVRRRLWYALMALAVMILLIFWLEQNVQLPEFEDLPELAQVEEVEQLADEEEALMTDVLPLPPIETFRPPSQWVVLVASFGLGLLLLAVVAGAVLFLWHRHHEPRPLLELAREAQVALNSLQDGSALRDVVLCCYYEMGRVLDETHGVRRAGAMTPREFETQLAALGLPQEPVSRLTRLFEEVRYGTRLPGPEEERRAIASLKSIVAACQEAP